MHCCSFIPPYPSPTGRVKRQQSSTSILLIVAHCLAAEHPDRLEAGAHATGHDGSRTMAHLAAPAPVRGDAPASGPPWFRTQHEGSSWCRVPSDFDQTALLNELRLFWERLGYSVLTEGQNSFTVRGSSAALAGKPDLVSRRGYGVSVIYAKTGRRPTRSAPSRLWSTCAPCPGPGAAPGARPRRTGRLPRPRGGHPGCPAA